MCKGKGLPLSKLFYDIIIFDIEGVLMKTCKSCKYFERDFNFQNKPTKVGECKKAVEGDDLYSDQLKETDAIFFDNEWHPITVGEDFGCIHHEEKNIKLNPGEFIISSEDGPVICHIDQHAR